jgi:hypothetical protein
MTKNAKEPVATNKNCRLGEKRIKEPVATNTGQMSILRKEPVIPMEANEGTVSYSRKDISEDDADSIVEKIEDPR